MDHIEKIRQELDQQLGSAPPNVGIAFGTELFNEFKQRGWLTLETFGVFGTTLFAGKVPAYGKTHFAFPTWGIQVLEFRVGKSE